MFLKQVLMKPGIVFNPLFSLFQTCFPAFIFEVNILALCHAAGLQRFLLEAGAIVSSITSHLFIFSGIDCDIWAFSSYHYRR